MFMVAIDCSLYLSSAMSHPVEKFILKPSTVQEAGVGCFAVTDIEEGERLQSDGPLEPNQHLPIDSIADTHLKYCPLLESGLYLAPANFATMSVFWYINHARNPNIVADKWRLYASEKIPAGEELFLYYPDLLTHPKNIEWVIYDRHVDPERHY